MQVGLTRLTVRGPVEHAVIELSGELDFSDAEDVMAAVAALPHTVAAVDVSGLEFIDSGGCRALHAILRTGAAGGLRPRLVGTSPAVQRTLSLVGARERETVVVGG